MEGTLRRANVGCGQTPTPGWLNYDNSLSLRLAKHRLLTGALDKLGVLGDGSKRNIAFARTSDVRWADATKRIPLPDGSLEVLYASHMIEHLDREEAGRFLKEVYRVLAPDGIIRIAVPDLRLLVDQYITDGDADLFVERTRLARRRPKTIRAKLRLVLVGEREHLWMYDGASMLALLSRHGFKEPRILEAGSTTIPNPGELDLSERADESVYVEARK